RFGALRVVVQEDVAFLAFDQSEHVDVVVHDRDSIHSGRGAGGWPTFAGLVGGGQVVSRSRYWNIRCYSLRDPTLPTSIGNPTTPPQLAFPQPRRGPRASR